ncbi:MAG: YSC84-related protein [Halieaceae bacterium]|jgi:lipid-binding SYLF domain-containing protein|uniref:YSC84-related protein n=1 Tax=Haliea alexandrii TaxID=2448162 RepID=UPI000F0B39A6|nr:YSC84-related protein [Haliea alexandrii]MCR9184360.1 YSC84-related protein [Halieaceae bacterium]
MKKTAVMPILYVLLALVLAPLARADNYAEALESFRNAGESAVYFDSAYGYALFPTIGKGGIGIGGAHGKGRVYQQGHVIGEATMTQLTVGFQLGGQAFSQIIFFQSANALEQFTSGNFEFGAQATAVAITAGVSAEASTGGGVSAGVSGGRNDASTASLGYRKGMAVFTIAKGGLMYEATLGGQKFNFTPN